MERKYELTDETMEYKGTILHRIKAVRDFDDVKKGDLGGWIEKEENLSQKGDCWVYDDVKVYGTARVYDDAKGYGCARVYDDAKVYGCAKVHEDAKVYGCAKVYGNADVFGNARVYENADVFGNADVYENAMVFGNAYVYGDAMVFGNAYVFGNARISIAARVNGDTRIESSDDIIIIGPIGSRHGYTTFYKTKNGIRVACGCYSGTLNEFKKEVKRCHGRSEHGKAYFQAIKFAKKRLKDKK